MAGHPGPFFHRTAGRDLRRSELTHWHQLILGFARYRSLLGFDFGDLQGTNGPAWTVVFYRLFEERFGTGSPLPKQFRQSV